MTDFQIDPFEGKKRAECWYADIIHLPYRQTKHQPHMSMQQRAAQFAPFSALSGFREALQERARVTEKFRQLDDDELAHLNRIVQYVLLQARLGRNIEIEVTYYVPDIQKKGGLYTTVKGLFVEINVCKKCMQLQGVEEDIPLQYISDLKVVE